MYNSAAASGGAIAFEAIIGDINTIMHHDFFNTNSLQDKSDFFTLTVN